MLMKVTSGALGWRPKVATPMPAIASTAAPMAAGLIQEREEAVMVSLSYRLAQ
jgi:hypothetical protein